MMEDRENYIPDVFDKAAKEAVALCKKQGLPIDPKAIIRRMFGNILQEALKAELDSHLNYGRYDRKDKHTKDCRNGYSQKTVKSSYGDIDLSIPRDRDGSFIPQLVKKGQLDVTGIEDQVITMYARGMTDRDIHHTLADLYGVNVSSGTISEITDRIIPELQEWQNRPLRRIYAYVFMDAAYFNVRQDNHVVKKANYTAIGVNMLGQREVLGMWLGASESASYWARVLDELRSRGVEDILLFAVDGLKGMVEAIHAVYPQALVQKCIVHQLRTCFKLVPYKDRRALAKAMKPIYKATTREGAEAALDMLEEEWGRRYPRVIKTWRDNWEELVTYYDLPSPLRPLIYTTNTVENFNRGLRKYTKARPSYPDDMALRKLLYLAMKNITANWHKNVYRWTQILNQLMLEFPDRIHPDDLDD